MRKLTYLAILEPSNDGYRVFYPDFPGCISYGEDIIQARTNAKEALEIIIYDMEKNSYELPSATIELDINKYRDCIVTPINILPDISRNELDNKRVKTNTTIPRWLKEIAEANNVNFSQLLEASLIEYLGLENYRNGHKEVKK